MRNPRTTSFALTLAAMLAAGGAVAQLPYSTSFESPTYAAGNLNGQDSWAVEAGVANVTNAGSPGAAPSGGTQYVTQPTDGSNPSSQINRNIDGTGASRVIFSGWYYGTGSQNLAAPDPLTGIAVLLGFEEINGSTFGIRKYDNGFVAPNPEQPFSNTAWHNVIVNIRYSGTGQQTYDVKVDGAPVFANVPFVSSVAKLNGFRSYSSTSASVDLLRFEQSNAGDFDGDGTTDDAEMLVAGRNPLVADAPPEVAVSYSGGAITDGQGTAISFGTVNQNDPDVDIVFTVSNSGDSALSTSAFDLTGTGFVVADPLSTSIAADSSDTFTIRMDTANAGTLNGTVSFANNDSDENPFNFSITGTVNSGQVGPGNGYLGDANGSRTVNATDLTVVRNNLADDYRPCSSVCRGAGDANQTGTVNATDFTVVRNNLGQDYRALPEYCTIAEPCAPRVVALQSRVTPRGANPAMFVQPSSPSAEVGEQIVVELRIDTAGSAARSAGTTLSFDPAVLSVATAVVPTNPWDGIASAVPNNTTGKIVIGADSTVDRTGELLLCTVTFNTLAAGTSNLTFDPDLEFSVIGDPQGNVLANLALTNGTATVTPVAPVGPKMFLSPDTANANAGQQVIVEVRIDTAGSAARSAGTTLSFDPSILSVATAVVPTNPWDGIASAVPNNTTGKIVIGADSTVDRTGELLLCTVTFNALAAGTSSLTFDPDLEFSVIGDPQGNVLANLTLDNGSVTVQAVQNNNPTVAITEPAADQTVTNATNSLNISGTAADSDGTVASVVYTVNGGSEQTATGTTSWTFTASGLNVGANTISVQSVDNLGARSTAATRTITRNTLPTVAVTTPSSNQNVPNGTTSFNFAGTAADANGTIASVSYTVNGGSVQAASGTTNWTFTASGLVVGANTVSVTATDNTGDVSAPVVRTITRLAPNQNPVVVVTNPATDITVPNTTGSFTISGTASDPAKSIVQVLFTIDGGDEEFSADGDTEWLVDVGLNVGNNVFQFVAVDDQGGRSAPVTRTICRSTGPLFNGNDLMVLTQFKDVWYASLQACGFETATRMQWTGFQHNVAGDHVSLFGDLDNDGLDDVLTVTNGGEFGPEVWTAKNAGDGTLGASIKNSTGWGVDKDPAVRQFLGLDFNGDGMMDLLQVENNNLVYAINTLGTIGAPQSVAVPGLTINSNIHLASGDFNGDGRDDILHLDNTLGTLTAIFGSSTNPGTTPPLPAVLLATSAFRYAPASNQAIVVGDYNADGNDDVAFVQDGAQGTPNVQVALMNLGGNALGSPTTWANQLGFHVDPSRDTGWWVFASDLDNDGDDDLIQQTGFQTIWASLSNGTSAFANAFPLAGLGYEHKPQGLWQIHAGNARN